MDVSEYYGEGSDNNTSLSTEQSSRVNPEPPTVTVTEAPSTDNEDSARMTNSSRKLSLAYAKLHRRKSSAPDLPEIRRHSHTDTRDSSDASPTSRRVSTFEFLTGATGL